MRLIIAAILGGIVMFMWGALSHMVLGLGQSDMKTVPDEAAVISTLKSKLTEPGFYFLPGVDMNRTPSEEEMAAFTTKHKEGPNAVLIYQPAGEDIMTPRHFGTELGSNIVAAFVVGLILTFAAVGFSRGVIISTFIGLTAWLSINVSYWNWYRFPTGFITGELIDQVAGWFLTGIVLAFILRKRD
jgi:hypothetical protein